MNQEGTRRGEEAVREQLAEAIALIDVALKRMAQLIGGKQEEEKP